LLLYGNLEKMTQFSTNDGNPYATGLDWSSASAVTLTGQDDMAGPGQQCICAESTVVYPDADEPRMDTIATSSEARPNSMVASAFVADVSLEFAEVIPVNDISAVEYTRIAQSRGALDVTGVDRSVLARLKVRTPGQR
jgi:hypothetical protein